MKHLRRTPGEIALRILGTLLYVTTSVALMALVVGAPFLAWHLTESVAWTVGAGVTAFILFTASAIVFLDSATW